jgi:hypothetical protein
VSLAPEVVGVGQILAAIIALLFFKPVYDNYETVGVRPFAAFIGGTIIWSVGHGIGKFVGDLSVSIALYNVVLLGVQLTAAGWFLTAVAVVQDDRVPRRLLGGIVATIVVLQALIWTNGSVESLYSVGIGR